MRLVALHAFPLDSRMWGFVSDAARRGELGAEVEVVTPDFRGRHAAERPAERVHGMPRLAKDVLEDLWGGPPFVLMGLSMGGYVALETVSRLSSEMRSLLRGLVLCDTRAGADDEAGKARREAVAAAIEGDGMEPLVADMTPKFLHRRARGGPLEELVARMMRETPPAAAAADQRGMAERADRFDTLAGLTVPLLVAMGDDDPLTPPVEGERMIEAAGNAPYVEYLSLPEAAHLGPLERPELFVPALGRFLERCALVP